MAEMMGYTSALSGYLRLKGAASGALRNQPVAAGMRPSQYLQATSDLACAAMTRTGTVLTLMLAAAVLSGCFGKSREPIYKASEEIDAIEVPADLSQPQVGAVYNVPGYSLPELAATGNEMLPPTVQPSEVAEHSRSQIRFGRSGLYLAIQDEPDSVWRRLGFALNRGDMRLESSNEDEFEYVFQLNHEPVESEKSGFGRLFFWRKAELIDYSGRYRIVVGKVAERGITAVELLGESGGVLDFDRAEYILAGLRDRLG